VLIHRGPTRRLLKRRLNWNRVDLRRLRLVSPRTLLRWHAQLAAHAKSFGLDDMGAAREHGIIDALTEAQVPVVADTAYQDAGPTVAVPLRRRRLDPDTAVTGDPPVTRRVNAAHARRCGPDERVNAELKNWRISRKIRSCPSRGAELVATIQNSYVASA
jgi:hypothetical protein